jgi:putative endonuclease
VSPAISRNGYGNTETASSPGFTKKYGCHDLVWFEAHDTVEAARQRELQMKEWKRDWKVKEIEGMNPNWDDLFDTLTPD